MAARLHADARGTALTLEQVDDLSTHSFTVPVKKIQDGPDVSFFLTSLAYRDIMTFIMQLNRAMVPRIVDVREGMKYHTWKIDSGSDQFSPPVQRLRGLIGELESLIADVPPDTGPRRFGNVSFRKWYNLVEARVEN